MPVKKKNESIVSPSEDENDMVAPDDEAPPVAAAPEKEEGELSKGEGGRFISLGGGRKKRV